MRADGAGAARGTGGDVDDAAPFARPHHRQHGLRAEEDRFQVHQNGLIEIGLGKFVEAAHDRDAGVVDEDIDRTEVTCDLFDHFCDGGGLRHIGGNGNRAAAIGLDFGDDGFRVIRALAIIDRDGGPEFGERHCNRGADAARAARHQRDMRAQILFRRH